MRSFTTATRKEKTNYVRIVVFNNLKKPTHSHDSSNQLVTTWSLYICSPNKFLSTLPEWRLIGSVLLQWNVPIPYGNETHSHNKTIENDRFMFHARIKPNWCWTRLNSHTPNSSVMVHFASVRIEYLFCDFLNKWNAIYWSERYDCNIANASAV